MDARTAILARARDAIGRAGSPDRPRSADIERSYIRSGEHAPGSPEVVAQMVEALEDYSAEVIEARTDAEIADAIDQLLNGCSSVVVPDGLPQGYRDAAARQQRTVREDSRSAPLSHMELDATDAVLTCSRVGISLSGTIVLDGEPDQGRRAISLVPDTHVCVLERESIQPTVPQAVDILGEHPTRPMTWIAGPSATSDIELIRVNGVHGPRNLKVIIAH